MGIAQAFLKVGMNIANTAIAESEDDKAMQRNGDQLRKAALRSDALAVDALRRGSFLGGLKRMEGSRTIAQQQVAYANSGVDSTVGTPAQMAGSTRLISEFDAQVAQNNAAREALGHATTADQYRDEWRNQVALREGRRTKRVMDTAGTFLSALGAGIEEDVKAKDADGGK